MNVLKFVISRLALVAVACLVCFATINPTIRQSINSANDPSSNLAIHVGRVDSALEKSLIQLRDVVIDNRSQWDASQLSFDTLDLKLDRTQFLRRNMVVRHAAAFGLKIKAELAAFDGETQFHRKPVIAQQKYQEGLSKIASFYAAMSPSPNDEFEVEQVARDLEQRRRRTFQRLSRNAKLLQRQLGQIEDIQNSEQFNPLRNTAMLRKHLSEFDDIKNDADNIFSELARLHSQEQISRAALAAARDSDVARAKVQFKWSTIEQDALTGYLLGSQFDAEVVELIRWIRWGRNFFGAKMANGNHSEINHETQISLLNLGGVGFRIEDLRIDGECEVNGESTHIQGNLAGLHGGQDEKSDPIHATFRTLSEPESTIELEIDRKSKVTATRLVIIRSLATPPDLKIGNSAYWSYASPSSQRDVRIEVEIKGEKLNGTITINDDLHAQQSPAVAFDSKQILPHQLSDAIRSVDQTRVVLAVYGTVFRPQWTLKSNLGERLAGPLNTAYETQIATKQRLLIAEIEQLHKTKLKQIETIETELSQLVQRQLNLLDTNIAQLERRLNLHVGQNVSLR